MNRIVKSILGIAALSFLAASCDVSQIGTIYTPSTDNQGVTFAQTVATDIEISPAQSIFNVDINRSTADAAITVNLKVEGFPEEIEIPSSVSFEAGNFQASIPINVSNLPIGVQAKGKISLATETDYDAGAAISTISVTIKKAYIWNSIGKGQFFDSFALMASNEDLGIVDVEILKADGFDRYRIMSPYSDAGVTAAEWAAGGERSPYIEFWVADNGENLVWDWWKPGILYEGDGTDIKAYFPSALSANYAASDAQSLILEEKVYQFMPYWYIDDLGGFGAKYPCFLAFPGVDLEAWLNEE